MANRYNIGLWQSFWARAIEACEPCQIREKAALSNIFCVPRGNRSGCHKRML